MSARDQTPGSQSVGRPQHRGRRHYWLLKNLLWVVFVGSPLFWALAGLQQLVTRGPQHPWQEWFFVALYFWLTFLLPIAVGSMVHQLLVLPMRTWPTTRRRAAVVLTSPVVLLPLLMLGMPSQQILKFLPAVSATLLVYAIFLRLPPPDDLARTS
jgi:phosphatidylserine synthase